MRSREIALAGFGLLLASAAPSYAQSMVGQQCMPAVANPGMYRNCRIAIVRGNEICRCAINPAAIRQPLQTNRGDGATSFPGAGLGGTVSPAFGGNIAGTGGATPGTGVGTGPGTGTGSGPVASGPGNGTGGGTGAAPGTGGSPAAGGNPGIGNPGNGKDVGNAGDKFDGDGSRGNSANAGGNGSSNAGGKGNGHDSDKGNNGWGNDGNDGGSKSPTDQR